MFIYLILMRQPFTVLKDEQFNSISWYSFFPLLPSYVELECVHITIWCGGGWLEEAAGLKSADSSSCLGSAINYGHGRLILKQIKIISSMYL